MANVTADQILDGAMGPNSVTADGITVQSGSTKDQLDALSATTADKNARKKRRGLLFARIVPGSAVGGPSRSDR